MKRSEAWFDQPTRQARIAILMIIFNVIKSLVRTWWPFLLILFFRGEFVTAEMGKIMTAVVTLTIIAFSILQYFRFFFYIANGKLHVQHGVFKKVKLDIPFDRIQSISFEQNLVHQFFDVVKLKVDTAGSSGEEFEFAALDRTKANELRGFILKQRGDHQIDLETGQPINVKSDQLILSLDPGDLLKVGISQNHFRTAGIVLAFLLGLRDNISDALGDRYVDEFDALTENVVNSGAMYLFYLFVALLVVSFFGTLIWTVIRYYNLHFWKTELGYKTEAGLFNRREQAALDHKIQILRWVSNPLRKLFGIVYLRLYQASSTRGSKRTTISVPGCPVHDLHSVESSYFGHWIDELYDTFGVEKLLFYRRAVLIGLLPALAIGSGFYFTQRWQWILGAVGWLLFMVTYQYFFQKRWQFRISQNKLYTTSGVLESVTKALALYKVQGVQLQQTPYQRRKNLSNLVLHTASGDVRIPYIKYSLALQIKNYILYKIESSKQAWM